MADLAHPRLPPAPASTGGRACVWRRLRRNWLSAVALGLIVPDGRGGAARAWVAPYDADATDAAAALQAPAWHHWLGTDIYGRDLLSRIIFAGRRSTSRSPSAPPPWRW